MMPRGLYVYNSLSRQKEIFEPLNAPFVGMYVCGPTVYGDAHLGHARPAVTFDVIYRYLIHLGYRVRYVRNITDVGHLEHDADEGEDKIGKKAKLEQVEPMEIAQLYTDRYHADMERLNVCKPNIEPRASGHIIEQIEMTQQLIQKGYAYEVNGSVYFDVEKYNQLYRYGILSGRVLDELEAGAGNERRQLKQQTEKKNPHDFALWKKANPEHIMQWQSPWGKGFPGWHIECSAMSAKYLGERFDIHGGGMDLLFPHHECEIAQSNACFGKIPAKYWLHNNMVTINGQKMGKSLGNFITLRQFFSGKHPLLEQPYSPMTIRFFILQSHYRSTLDFSNEALKAASKGYKRLMNGLKYIKSLSFSAPESVSPQEKHLLEIEEAIRQFYQAMNDDFNTAVAIAALFQMLKKINQLFVGQIQPSLLGEDGFNKLKNYFITFTEDILGLLEEKPMYPEKAIQLAVQHYAEAKQAKNYAKVDEIRAHFKEMGLVLRDMKDRIEWAYDEN
ncbi:MAG: cysteine--tRNA ligase [Cytophagales bacterium]|nr:cysteine--tRNA ligase [Cytophagales bacterium]MDW8384040.1 cysteine--tRNA ligase [Flammeovirgaceae bacterium]